jgi:hypothetical protein
MFWRMEDLQTAQIYFKKWYFRATHSKLPAVIKVAKPSYIIGMAL